jgi:hypothetical protein
MGITVAEAAESPAQFLWIIGIVGGLLALVIH